MSSEINLNPANEPRFPISPTVLDTEGHTSRARRIEEAGEETDDDTEGHLNWNRRIEDAGTDTADDTEGHLNWNRRIEDAGTDTEGHRRAPLV